MTGWACRAVVIGCSAGGLEVLRTILPRLPADYPWPVVVVSHTTADAGDLLAQLLDRCCALPVRVAEDTNAVAGGTIYVAPPGYHLLIERDQSFALSIDAKVCNVRPAIDVLFQSAAEAFDGRLVGVLLTGANEDGRAGMVAIKALGGLTLVQDPETAFADIMPRSAITAGVADYVLAPAAIADFLVTGLNRPGRA
jgi:two-component system chemotaxis response regulator CheB